MLGLKRLFRVTRRPAPPPHTPARLTTFAGRNYVAACDYDALRVENILYQGERDQLRADFARLHEFVRGIAEYERYPNLQVEPLDVLDRIERDARKLLRQSVRSIPPSIPPSAANSESVQVEITSYSLDLTSRQIV